MLLTSRKLLQRKLLDVESDLRGTLRNFGLKVGVVSTGKFEARIRELVEDYPQARAGRRANTCRPAGHAAAICRPPQNASRHSPP